MSTAIEGTMPTHDEGATTAILQLREIGKIYGNVTALREMMANLQKHAG